MDGNAITDALFGGLKRVGEAGIDLTKGIASIPLNIATALPDFLKDPEVFLAGGRENAIAALLSKDFRNQQKANLEADRSFTKLKQHKDAVDWVSEMFTKQAPTSGKSPAEFAQSLRDQGIPDEYVQQGLQADYAQGQQRKSAREAYIAAGESPQTADLLAGSEADQDVGKNLLMIERAKAVQARADQRAAGVNARADREAGLRASREARLAGQPKPKTFAEKAAERRAERASNRVFDAEAANAEATAGPLIDTITDPAMRGKLRAKAVGQAKAAAEQVINETLPPTSRKNLAARRAAKQALKEIPDDRLAPDPVIDETPLPTDPAERVKAAEVLGTQLLKAGFPPDKAAAELIRRGFKPEELPE